MEEKMNRARPAAENPMGTARMLPLILKMALPAMFSMLIQALYNIVDSYFVAQVGQNALTAVSLAFPIQNLQVAFGVGTGVGVSSLISRRLGERDQKAADNAATHGIILAAMTWVVFAIAGAATARPFIAMYTQDAEVLSMGQTYLTIVTVFSFGFFIGSCIEKMIQATGNMILPMIMQLIGAVTNIILDPIMIYGLLGFPAMGVAGAAIATVGGQIISMIACVLILFLGSHAVSIHLKGFRFHARTIRDIYTVGVPSIVMSAIGTVMTMAMNGILAAFSAVAVNAFGIYFKLQSFVFMPVFGLTQGLMPIMGYNYGARNKHRVTGALKDGIIIALVINLAGMIVFETFPEQLISIFNPTDELMRIGVPALRIIAMHFPLAAVGIAMTTLFQATGKGMYSLIQSLMRQLVVLVPAAWLLAKISLDAVWFAFPIAEVASLVVTAVFFTRLYNREIRHLGES
ncbi:MAG: MATE family efflux transporter [Hominenteromicrobium sp.]